jgi:hypothetical protein
MPSYPHAIALDLIESLKEQNKWDPGIRLKLHSVKLIESLVEDTLRIFYSGGLIWSDKLLVSHRQTK